MKFPVIQIALAITSVFVATGAFADTADQSANAALNDLLGQANHPISTKAYAKQQTAQGRIEALTEIAKNTAISKGMQYEMSRIRDAIKEQERELDAIYNFSPLMIQGRVVPPVITEAKDVLQNPDELTIKTTGAVYKIASQARFSTTPPNWRSYLSFPPSDGEVVLDDTVTSDMAPKTMDEREAWQKATVSGFNQGINQADNIFKYAFNRLNRDYIGMARFHEFALSGKVSLPSISSQTLAVAGSSSAISLDQHLLTIRTLPSFDSDISKWSTWITPVTTAPSGQQLKLNKVE